MIHDPFCHKQRADHIKILFDSYFFTLQIVFIITVRHVPVMVQALLFGIILFPDFPQFLECRTVPVYDRRSTPLKNGRIGFMHELQSLFQIPVADVQRIIQLPFNHVPGLLQLQIIFQISHIYKPDIVITVRGSKSPCPAAGFHRHDDPDIFFIFNLHQFFPDDLFHIHDLYLLIDCLIPGIPHTWKNSFPHSLRHSGSRLLSL